MSPAWELEEEHNDFQELGPSPYAVRKLDPVSPTQVRESTNLPCDPYLAWLARDAGPEKCGIGQLDFHLSGEDHQRGKPPLVIKAVQVLGAEDCGLAAIAA